MESASTLLDCAARFTGLYGKQHIKQFTEFVQLFKKVKRIPDEQALEELTYLLNNHAYSWWCRRKHLFKTWPEALAALTEQFSKCRPAYVVYAELFQCNQQNLDNDHKVLDFIKDKVELLHELSEEQNNSMEIRHFNIIWALLPPEKRSTLQLLNINSFNELVDYLNENINYKKKTSTNKNKKRGKNIEIYSNGDVSDRGCPIIKVKRTADLMPIISSTTKQPEDCKENESTVLITTNNGNAKVSFSQIDRDITGQITSIADTSDNQRIKTVNASAKLTSFVIDDEADDDDKVADVINSQNHDNMHTKIPQITYLLNGETTIVPEIPLPSAQKLNEQQQSNEQLFNKEKKVKIRCGFCHNYGHRSVACLKKIKYMHLYPERFKNNGSKCARLSKSNKLTKDIMALNKVFIPNDNNVLISNISSSIPSNISISLQEVDTQRNDDNHADDNSNCNEHNMIRKIIKLTKNNTNVVQTKSTSHTNNCKSNSKCHQCGTTGYYRSICPNCSPIYFYKPIKPAAVPPPPR